MASLKKILLCPYFGDFPSWWDKFEFPEGYDHIVDTDLEGFKKRVRDKLGIEYPGEWGGTKVWDYRCSLGLLYEEEIKGYDFYGHCDFDMVFGDINNFIPDELLNDLDLYSGHNTYVCGCFSIYRNRLSVNTLFKEFDLWKEKMIYERPTGWVEQEYSITLERSGLKYLYTFNQGWPWTADPILKKEGNKLFQEINGAWREIAFFHFRHSKPKWPL